MVSLNHFVCPSSAHWQHIFHIYQTICFHLNIKQRLVADPLCQSFITHPLLMSSFSILWSALSIILHLLPHLILTLSFLTLYSPDTLCCPQAFHFQLIHPLLLFSINGPRQLMNACEQMRLGNGKQIWKKCAYRILLHKGTSFSGIKTNEEGNKGFI